MVVSVYVANENTFEVAQDLPYTLRRAFVVRAKGTSKLTPGALAAVQEDVTVLRDLDECR